VEEASVVWMAAQLASSLQVLALVRQQLLCLVVWSQKVYLDSDMVFATGFGLNVSTTWTIRALSVASPSTSPPLDARPHLFVEHCQVVLDVASSEPLLFVLRAWAHPPKLAAPVRMPLSDPRPAPHSSG